MKSGKVLQSSPQAIAEGVKILKAGGLVAFPTETVYGLGADATNAKAIETLYTVKARPLINPLIIHVPSLERAREIARLDQRALYLGETLWPGALTLVLRRKSGCAVCSQAMAGLETVAIRVPDHPTALTLLQGVDRPIAAPSANRSGRVSATAPTHILHTLKDRIDLILAEGKCRIGIESTILDLSEVRPRILRHGFVTRADLEDLIGETIEEDAAFSKEVPKSPGRLLTHYAPSIPLRLNVTTLKEGEALLGYGWDGWIRGSGARLNLSKSGDLYQAAENLYAMLHVLDSPEHTAIAVMSIPNHGLGVAINDRLRRASGQR